MAIFSRLVEHHLELAGLQIGAATLAANCFDVVRERRTVIRRSKNTVSDASPMTARTIATAIAGTPMCRIISVQLNPMPVLLFSACTAFRPFNLNGI